MALVTAEVITLNWYYCILYSGKYLEKNSHT